MLFKVCSCVVSNKTVTGVINIIISLIIESKSNLWGTDSLEKAEIQQWLEYGIVYAVHVDEPQNYKLILRVSKYGLIFLATFCKLGHCFLVKG